ncbi:Pro-Pol polyprotein [Araneus ventricosus]|uniref:Pro-Pol polyprotein n=1 Tax=Araneus ventricosus TaxID=182803 RepID=A0A4Y2WQH7_ARAVE|nr:Pro-Pol polyprotein [Araneus ventricosus]
MTLMPGFVKGQSGNLPKIDSLSMFSFLGNNPDFMGAEIRGFKAQRSGREGYGDNAIDYVQVKRDADICSVNANVTPEHSGFKHDIALLMWLQRWSEEPAVISVKSYWRKSNLSYLYISFRALDFKTKEYIGVREGKTWFSPTELGRECDLFFSSRGKSLFETNNSKLRKGTNEPQVINRPPEASKGESFRRNKNQNIKPERICFVCGAKGEYFNFAKNCPRRFEKNKNEREVSNHFVTSGIGTKPKSIPLSTYHVDFIGPLPSTNKRYQHIFTVVDAFTKFVWFYPVKTTSAAEALQKLKIQQIVFGNPSKIISDKGSAFTSKDFEDYCKDEGIQHIQITTGVPRVNGQIERMHGTLIPVIAKLSIDDPAKWFKFVPDVQRIINSTISRSTKFTPFVLVTGVKMRNKADLKIKEILDEEYMNSIIQEKETIREEAKVNIFKVQEENRRQYNRRRRNAPIYKINDLVAIKRTQLGGGLKLKPKFLGPYKVVKIKPHDRYDVVKVGSHEGPAATSTSADHMKFWSDAVVT